ncbi:class I SAM-dependent methyltransferase [Oceaniglobus trochenteri]|uniref:class I SAM-dependent methyltransferase n=1 Tax=Oceaniglobus trochenteri TaxID=2763260 RepID=UPI001CFF97A0|nr:class I SAM-dependent methyltransferase [Oceaniglobus trochenteri]
MSKDLIEHYRSLLQTHGPGAKAVQWADAETQTARFSVLSQIADPLGSVLDVGCGLGQMCFDLRARGWGGRYHGVDIVPDFVDLANKALEHDPLADVSLAADRLPEGFDYALLSGVFNNAQDDNWGFATDMLRRMWEVSTVGIGFNAMTSHVDYFDPGLWYVDPLKMFDFCKRELGGHPVLRHDYALRPGGFPFEFAIYVYKSPRPASA